MAAVGIDYSDETYSRVETSAGAITFSAGGGGPAVVVLIDGESAAVKYVVALYCMAVDGIALYCMAVHGILWQGMA